MVASRKALGLKFKKKGPPRLYYRFKRKAKEISVIQKKTFMSLVSKIQGMKISNKWLSVKWRHL